MGARGRRAPVGDRGGHDDQVAVNHGRHRPAALRGEGSPLFAQRAFPEKFPVLAQRDGLRTGAQGVEVARFEVGRRRGPADPVRRRVALKHVELVFPDDLAGVRIERHHTLLQVRAAAGGILHVDPVADDDRGRAAAVGDAPQEVRAVERKRIDEPGFAGDPVAVRASHLRPVAYRNPPRPLCQSSDADRNDERAQQPASLEHRHRSSCRLPAAPEAAVVF
jgi:hypothetical protein